MSGFVTNIEDKTLENDNFREVIYTADHGQIVLMKLLPKEEIGEEVHKVDQFFRIERGEGIVIINGDEHHIEDGSAILVPAGSRHNVINTSSDSSMRLYTIYMPPQHRDHTIHKTKAEAEADEHDHA
ncbi:MAG: cupin domain-containing protein [Candidatus Taylorbacteria bacterium]|nr:cupin domain-containing protein [Candidatus Taylorbacteria bacterium]